MYLNGMGDYYNDDEFVVYDYGGEVVPNNFPVYSPDPQPQPQIPAGQPGGTSWASVFNTALNTWGQVEARKAQTATPPRVPGYPGYYPSSSPFPGYPGYPAARGGTIFGLSTTTLLVLAGVGVGLYVISGK